jgi:hypothetical protein
MVLDERPPYGRPAGGRARDQSWSGRGHRLDGRAICSGADCVLNRSRTPDDHNVDVVTEDIRRYVSQARPSRPLFRIDHPVWTIAAGALLRVYKDGVRFAVADDWPTLFGEAFEANGREDAGLTITGSRRVPVLVVDR